MAQTGYAKLEDLAKQNEERCDDLIVQRDQYNKQCKALTEEVAGLTETLRQREDELQAVKKSQQE